jgi:hypothetical protein
MEENEGSKRIIFNPFGSKWNQMGSKSQNITKLAT